MCDNKNTKTSLMYETIHEIRYRIKNEAVSWGAVFIGHSSFEDFKRRNGDDITIISHKTRKWLK
tara:strand:- start:463 stop:654 length:192 start_codon:yes stop_codon:yes gene_type:complete